MAGSTVRGRPGDPNVRKSREVGPDYPEELYRNPWGGDVDSSVGNHDDKTILSPNGTTFGGGDIPLHHDYDSNWPESGRKGRK